MTTILLARHGETDWNRERRWQGRADRPLNDTGRTQARQLAEVLASREIDADRAIDAVYASDLLRARETAEIVAARLRLPVGLDPELREVDVGDWAGRLASEIERDDPEGYRRWQEGRQGWRGGESYDELGERMVAAVLRIAARHPAETILLVTHGGSIRACRAAAARLTYAESRPAGIVAAANCELVELRIVDDRLVAV